MPSQRNRTRSLIRPAFILGASVLGGVIALAQQPAQRPQPRPETVIREEVAPKPVAADAQIKVFPLKNASAREICGTLQSILNGVIESRIVADNRTNVLLVAVESAKDLARVEPLIQALDQPVETEVTAATVVQSVPLGHATARSVGAQLENLLMRNRGLSVNIVADQAANSVWISGRPGEVERFVEVAKRMDDQAAQPAGREMNGRELRFYVLKEADAGSLASTLNRTAELLSLNAEIVPDMQSGTVLAIATPESQKRLEQIINTLDVSPRRAPRPGNAPAGPPPARDGNQRPAPAPAQDAAPRPNGR